MDQGIFGGVIVLNNTFLRPHMLSLLLTYSVFEADALASKIAKHRRKLPAGNFVPGIDGWLCHVLFDWGHLGDIEQVLVTTASVPI